MAIKKELSKIDHLFKKGASGNPAGRPKLGLALSDSLRAMLNSKSVTINVEIKRPDGFMDKRTYDITADRNLNDLVALALIEKAISSDVPAINAIFDRLEGKPTPSKPESLNEDDNEFENLPPKEKEKLLLSLIKKATK